MKHTTKHIIFSLISRIAPSIGHNASVLMYHSIGNNGALFTVAPTDFESQLEYISRNFESITLSELFRRLSGGKRVSGAVALTFDDGYMDIHKTALPLLEQYGIRGTVFIPTGLVGKTYTTSDGVILPLMGWKELRDLERSGLVEVMPHTASHRELAGVGKEVLEVEIIRSRIDLERELGGRRDILAFPRGVYDDALLDYLRHNGWAGAVSVKPGLLSDNNDLFQVPRNAIDSSTSFAEFKAKLSKGIEWYERLKEIL